MCRSIEISDDVVDFEDFKISQLFGPSMYQIFFLLEQITMYQILCQTCFIFVGNFNQKDIGYWVESLKMYNEEGNWNLYESVINWKQKLIMLSLVANVQYMILRVLNYDKNWIYIFFTITYI